MTTQQAKLARSVSFRPAFDKRSPSPSRDYGIHGAEIRFKVQGPLGAVTFCVMTNWHLPSAYQHLQDIGSLTEEHTNRPISGPAVTHRLATGPVGDAVPEECSDQGGRLAVCDGSYQLGERFFAALVEEGDDALYALMELEYSKMERSIVE